MNPFQHTYFDTIKNWFKIYLKTEQVIEEEKFSISYKNAFLNLLIALLITNLSLIFLGGFQLFIIFFIFSFLFISIVLLFFLIPVHLIAQKLSKKKTSFQELFYYSSLPVSAFIIISSLLSLFLPLLSLILLIYLIYTLNTITSITCKIPLRKAFLSFLPSIALIILLLIVLFFLVQPFIPQIQQVQDCYKQTQNQYFCSTIYPFTEPQDYCNLAPEEKKPSCYQLLLNQTGFLKEHDFCEKIVDENYRQECLERIGP